MKGPRADFAVIAGRIRPGAKVLDLGCGDGSLLRHLRESLDVRGYGIEIDDAKIPACVKNGINVLQMDLESGLSGFDPGSFDYVILSLTLQAMKNSERILSEMLRVGREGIVSVPNFGYWRNRIQLAMGRMPVNDEFPHHWFDTPNIHLCTLTDFEVFCVQHRIRILERIALHEGREVSSLPNLRGSLVVYRFGSGA
ncbi:MAG: methionine biosynthesis protein MetW [bacterium]|jgi:methionine biosynthesis protein MetW|nr:methionine biosynthesis protein MetW [Betaproteobacteria bacterium]